jgi:hypothetical protein
MLFTVLPRWETGPEMGPDLGEVNWKVVMRRDI